MESSPIHTTDLNRIYLTNGIYCEAPNLEKNICQEVWRWKSAGHYKQYNNHIQEILNNTNLGFNIGPHNISNSVVAGDLLAMSDDPGNLQIILNLILRYGHKYRIFFSAGKMIITIFGSKKDQKYWQITKPWSMDNKTIDVVINNEHLGQVISGENATQKNVDNNIVKTRKCLFSLLGSPFSTSSNVNPSTQYNTWSIYAAPILRSGLGSLVLQPESTELKTLELFQRKVLQSFLGFSGRSPISGVHFILGELPIAGQLASETLSLFWNLWSNRESLVFKVSTYILIHANENSRCWCIFVRHLTRQLGLPDPLKLLQNVPPSKDSWMITCNDLVLKHHLQKFRENARRNSRLTRMNVELLDLKKPHPLLAKVLCPREVKKLKIQLKVLCGDFYCKSVIGLRNNTSTACLLCDNDFEDELHVFGPSGCPALKEPHDQIIPQIKAAAQACNPVIDISDDAETFVRFVCDPTNPSLNHNHRVNLNNTEECESIFQLTRHYIFCLHSLRARKIKKLPI